jgi:hypothetical protein
VGEVTKKLTPNNEMRRKFESRKNLSHNKRIGTTQQSRSFCSIIQENGSNKNNKL